MLTFAPVSDQKSFLSDVLEELHDEVYVYDADTLGLVYANRSARHRCNWSPETVSNHKIQDTSRGFDLKGFLHHVEPLRKGTAQAVTIETRHEKGLVEITTRLVSSLTGGEPVFVSVLRDREHRRQLERARAQAFSEIVHDLRTPLTSIMGAIKLLDAGTIGDIPTQAQSLLHLIQRNADNLLSIVGDILDVQKLSNNQPQEDEDAENVELVALTKEAVAAHLGYCAIHNVSINLCAVPDHAWIRGVPLRLHQLLANLLSNAIKNSPQNDSVGVEVQRNGAFWQIRVSNGGPGIPEHLRDRIFDSYVQSNSPGQDKVKGTGLGLGICKKIVKSHGGELNFSCDKEGRTVFFVDFPVLEPSPDQ